MKNNLDDVIERTYGKTNSRQFVKAVKKKNLHDIEVFEKLFLLKDN